MQPTYYMGISSVWGYIRPHISKLISVCTSSSEMKVAQCCNITKIYYSWQLSMLDTEEEHIERDIQSGWNLGLEGCFDFGLYDQLMVELRNEDQRAFRNFLCMPTEMYDKMLDRVGPTITRQHTRNREPLEPGLKLALIMQHLASGSSFSTMQYGWRVPNSTQSVIVLQVCQAFVDEYLPDVLTCHTTPEEWRGISDKFLQKWNFPHACVALDGKHIACKCPPPPQEWIPVLQL